VTELGLLDREVLYQSTRSNIPEDLKLHLHHQERQISKRKGLDKKV